MVNRVTELFNIRYPVVQGGMVWCSGWRLATAVTNAGGLGLIGAGSMDVDLLREHIAKARVACSGVFGVNIPLMKPEAPAMIDTVIDLKVPVVFTSAGNPATYTQRLKEAGIKVAHVVANTKFARKAEEAGVDALVAEGFEAGGHNGREETTTLVLVPLIRRVTSLPLIAAGGIFSGASMLAAIALGADGVQLGSRFAIAAESSAHEAFKHYVVASREGDTLLTLKKLIPVRMMRNAFFDEIQKAEASGAGPSELLAILGKGRSRKGMFEGDLSEGELEIGQVAALADRIEPVSEVMDSLLEEYNRMLAGITNIK